MTRKLADEEKKIVLEFISKSITKDLDNKKAAEEIDADLRKGTGFTAEQFKPLTFIWDMTESIKEESDFSTANQKIRNFLKQIKSL